ncbi:MAG TPA: hypothetical protein ENJ39_01095 [Flammeovirgaceae bacterium]|nr:hypothetical protein [Flammeovirgaceae bacterium]
MKNIVIILAVFGWLLTACEVAPQEINYGKDGCHFCKMTIVDNQHAAELVTAKGKAYKFDSIECLIHDLRQREDEVALLLVCDYSRPGELIDARQATYLISQNIPSPMGAYLSAFDSRQAAEAVQAEQGGDLYTWQEVQQTIK